MLCSFVKMTSKLKIQNRQRTERNTEGVVSQKNTYKLHTRINPY